MEMKCLTKENIFKSEAVEKEWVDIPEWAGGLYVKVMSGEERDAFETAMFKTNDMNNFTRNFDNMRARLIAFTAVDEDGKQIFDPILKYDVQDKLYGDVAELGKKSSVILDRIYVVAQKLNKLRKEDIEDLTKNSLKGQSEDSISD
jgi:hypothetical protein